MTRAVVLLSGGLDSSTALAWAVRQQQWECKTVCFDYGQRHHIELQAAANVARFFGVEDHRVIRVDLDVIAGSALTGDMPVPKDRADQPGIPTTYVPARNLIFLSLATAMAEAVDASRVVIGANVVDYSGYPDCRPEFLSSFLQTARLGTRMGVEGRDFDIAAPLIHMKKSEIIALGLKLGLDYSLTRSCYDPLPNGMPCGHCDSCHFRRQGFAAIGVVDPLPYPEDV